MEVFSWDLIGLFSGSFVSATIIPFPSEGLLVAFFEMNYPIWLCVTIATLGNSLGGITNYFIGRFGSSEVMLSRFKMNQANLEKWENKFTKHGHFIGLLAWLPIIGDPMLIALGFLKVKFWPLSIMIFIGKMIRYIILALIYMAVI